MDNRNIDDRINHMNSQKLKAEQFEVEKRKISENARREQEIKFHETFGMFFDIVKHSKDRKDDLFTLLTNDKLMCSYNGVKINIKPNNFDILTSSIYDNHIYLAISFDPVNSSELINDITWSINKKELCSFITRKTESLENDKFFIPQNIYFGISFKNNLHLVEKVVTSINSYKYHYIVKISYVEENSEYKFKTISNCKFSLENVTYCCINIYNKKLECNISKIQLLENIQTIENDLNNILSNNITNNELLRFSEQNKPKVFFTPFELDEEYWNRSCTFLNRNIITDYPRYMAKKLINNLEIYNLNRESFKYTYDF